MQFERYIFEQFMVYSIQKSSSYISLQSPGATSAEAGIGLDYLAVISFHLYSTRFKLFTFLHHYIITSLLELNQTIQQLCHFKCIQQDSNCVHVYINWSYHLLGITQTDTLNAEHWKVQIQPLLQLFSKGHFRYQIKGKSETVF